MMENKIIDELYELNDTSPSNKEIIVEALNKLADILHAEEVIWSPTEIKIVK